MKRFIVFTFVALATFSAVVANSAHANAQYGGAQYGANAEFAAPDLTAAMPAVNPQSIISSLANMSRENLEALKATLPSLAKAYEGTPFATLFSGLDVLSQNQDTLQNLVNPNVSGQATDSNGYVDSLGAGIDQATGSAMVGAGNFVEQVADGVDNAFDYSQNLGNQVHQATAPITDYIPFVGPAARQFNNGWNDAHDLSQGLVGGGLRNTGGAISDVGQGRMRRSRSRQYQ